VSRDAEGRATIRAVRTAPLRIDGALDDALYSAVPPIGGFVQVEPQVGVPSAERTEVWVAFDDDNLYVTFKNWESEPGRRVASDMRRDGNILFNSDDVVNLFLDPFLDRRNGISITVNSIGGRNDGQLVNDQYNRDWSPIWNYAVGDFDGGWVAEYALPFRSLRYRPGRDQVWGINALRAVRWRNELSVLSPVPQGMGMSSAQHAALAATVVGIEAPPPGRNLDIKPYAISTLTSDRSASPRLSNDFGRDAGLDVKYAITQNLVADFTYNTDFAQVEADEQQVNLTRFSLFFPEKREFFLENAGTFSFGGVPVSGNNAGGSAAPILFYSRRIGLESGAVVPLQAGGRISGRLGPYSLGVLSIRADELDTPTTTMPGTTFSVVRVKRDILRRSAIGVLATARSTDRFGRGRNLAYGADATFGFFANLNINTYWARTQTDQLDGDDTSYRAQVNLNGDRYGFEAERMAIGRDFNPEVGLVRRPDMRRSFGQVRFSPRPQAEMFSAIRKFSYSGSVNYIENGAGVLETRERSAAFGIDLQNSDTFDVTLVNSYEFLPRPFAISRGVTIPVGGYAFTDVQAQYSIAQQRPIRAVLSISRGSFYSGDKTTFRATGGRVRVSNQISLEPGYTLNQVDLAEGQFTSHLLSTRATYTMTPLMFVSALVQYNTESRSVSTNARLRWEYQPGSELFVVYNEQRDTFGVRFPELNNRALIVKINRLFRF
jgi:hypothetical protein